MSRLLMHYHFLYKNTSVHVSMRTDLNFAPLIIFEFYIKSIIYVYIINDLTATYKLCSMI